MVDFNSPYYPYERPATGYNQLKGAEMIPHQILMYLLDLPDKNGYVPVDDNSRPRVRLIKYIYYDDSNPLAQPLPTPEQKLSLVYDGKNPDINTDEDKKLHPLGYRIFGQQYAGMSQTHAKTLFRCFMARAIPRSDYKTVLGINFSVIVNYMLDNIIGTGVYSRMYAIHQCLVEALHGVNITGIGTIYYNKSIHGDCGMSVYHDEQFNIYGDTFMAIDWQETTTPEVIQEWDIR
jgi:hypothetical protein